MLIDDALIFVDGENLTLRYQEMVTQGRSSLPTNSHFSDAFIWNQSVLDEHLWNLKRISYYTSVVGDDDKVRAVRNEIAGTKFICRNGAVAGPTGTGYMHRTGQLMPFVRKKAARSRKESICDVQLAVDVLRACYRDHARIIWIFTGDGDFLPLFEEVVHSGKTVYVSAFSSGMNEEIPHVVDEFIPLDKHFFSAAQEMVAASTSAPAGSEEGLT